MVNKTQEALKMAICDLELCNGAETVEGIIIYTHEAIQACKEALAELEQTKPVGKIYNGNAYWVGEAPDNGTPLYTSPQCLQEQSAEIAHYKAQINELREALICIDEDLVNPVYYRLVKEALAKTAPQCLQAHDDEVIDRCAKVCDEIGKRDQFTKITASAFAHEIRALKGKQND